MGHGKKESNKNKSMENFKRNIQKPIGKEDVEWLIADPTGMHLTDRDMETSDAIQAK